MAIFQSRQCLFQSSHFVDKKTRTVLFLFLVFRYRSYQFKKLGTMIVPFYKQAQTFSQREVCSCL